MLTVHRMYVLAKKCSLSTILCVDVYQGEQDGVYMSCDNCHEYLEIKDGIASKKSCPDTPGWGFNAYTHKCEFRSPHCFECVGGSLTLNTALLRIVWLDITSISY